MGCGNVHRAVHPGCPFLRRSYLRTCGHGTLSEGLLKRQSHCPSLLDAGITSSTTRAAQYHQGNILEIDNFTCEGEKVTVHRGKPNCKL